MSVCRRRQRVLCDTGSTIDVVSEATADKLLNRDKKLMETAADIGAEAVNGTKLDLRGMIRNVRFKYGNKIAKLTLYVQRDAGTQLLLGRDSLNRLGISLNLGKSSTKAGEGEMMRWENPSIPAKQNGDVIERLLQCIRCRVLGTAVVGAQC